MATCNQEIGDRRRLFWATQPTEGRELCGFSCGLPGLSVIDRHCDEELDCEGAASIDTTNWVRGLIINMLMTDGRKADSQCGYRPGAQGGHWSSSYIEQGDDTIGTLIRTVETSGRVNELRALVTAYARSTLERLVARGVATKIEVATEYLGSGRFALDIEVYGVSSGVTKVGFVGERLSEQWVWDS